MAAVPGEVLARADVDAQAQPMTRGAAGRQERALRVRGPLSAAAVLVAAVALWQVAVVTGLLDRAAVAEPSAVLHAARALLGTSAFRSALAATTGTWLVGWSIALAVAVPVGLLLGSSPLAYQLTRFSIDFLRTIPPVALLPLALLLFGATDRMAVGLIVVGSVWPVLLQAMYGVHQIDPVAHDVARSYRVAPRQRVLCLVVPSAAPFLATGARLAATMALLLAIGTEVVGGAPGIGSQITLQQQTGQLPAMYVYVVVSALLGVAANLLLTAVERRVLSWHSSYRTVA